MPTQRTGFISTALFLALSACGVVPSDVNAAQQTRRSISERDAVAFANVYHFANTSGAPHHHELSREQVEELRSLLNTAADYNNGRMPPFFSEAAAFWTKVRRTWPDLSAAQRREMREYAGTMTSIRVRAQPLVHNHSTRDHRHSAHAHDHSTHDHRHSAHADDHSAHAHNHSAHDHRHSSYAHNHSGHDHSHSASGNSRSTAKRRYDPAAVTAEVTNAPLAVGAIFP